MSVHSVSLCILRVSCGSGCEIDSARKPGLAGDGGEEARDGQASLHLASSRGQEEVVQKLIECGVTINAQDAMGRSALHISIRYLNINALFSSQQLYSFLPN